MANDVAQNLKAYLQSQSTVREIAAERVYEDHVPQVKDTFPKPFVWFGIRQENPSPTLAGATGELPDSVSFDLECVASIRDKAKDLARVVRACLHNYYGNFGDSTVKGIFVQNKDSEYLPKNGDRGLYVMSFDVEVWSLT